MTDDCCVQNDNLFSIKETNVGDVKLELNEVKVIGSKKRGRKAIWGVIVLLTFICAAQCSMIVYLTMIKEKEECNSEVKGGLQRFSILNNSPTSAKMLIMSTHIYIYIYIINLYIL